MGLPSATRPRPGRRPRRWPVTEWPRLSLVAAPGLLQVLPQMRAFLDESDRGALQRTCRRARYPWHVQDAIIYRPKSPFRRRCYGFGMDTPAVTATHSVPGNYLILHLVWDILDPRERLRLIDAVPTMRPYAYLRCRAAQTSVASLRSHRPYSKAAPIDTARVELMGMALLRFDFNYADLVRWLEGEFTNDGRDWDATFDILDSVRDIPPPPDYPPVAYDRAWRMVTLGSPLAGNFECTFAATAARNLYDNHPNVANADAEVREKIRKEEHLSYHVLLPRWLWRFLEGLQLCPINWHIRREGEEGRVCCDATTIIAGVAGPNESIPKPGTEDREDECPSIHYGTALTRACAWLWNLRISYPEEELIINVDDISAAFHRILYHPTAALVFATVFAEFLAIPAGSCFGAGNSPSFYMVLGELRAHLANAADFRGATTALTDAIAISPAPTAKDKATMATAIADEAQPGSLSLIASSGMLHRNSSFVDDNETADIRRFARLAMENSVLAAYVVFGFPGEDRRPPCINPAKWAVFASWLARYLGFDLDSRRMMVIWPVDKRHVLIIILDTKWLLPDGEIPWITPFDSSQVLGTARHSSLVSAIGPFLSIRLQHHLNKLLPENLHGSRQKRTRWWKTSKSQPLMVVMDDLRFIRGLLDDDVYNPAWCRSIGLLIQRTPKGALYSDASYEGLGGLLAAYFKWRLSYADLIACGFPRAYNAPCLQATCPDDPESERAHINILEFVAIIINVWLLLRFIQTGVIPRDHDYVYSVLADNTSALSWMYHASRSNSPQVQRLSRLYAALLLAHDVPLRIQSAHVRGVVNVAADALSRVSEFPSWESATRADTQLAICPVCQIPRALLSTIASCIAGKWNEERCVQKMTSLLTIALVISTTGSSVTGTTTSLSPLSQRRAP
mgnify:CR=1 FL=1